MKPDIKILCVDDERVILDSIADYFAGDYEIHAHSDPRQALEELRAGRFDILVVDERMPGLSGRELLEAGRSLGAYGYGILLTAYAERELLETFIDAGLVRKVLEKPLDLEELSRALAEAAAECRSSRRAIIEEAADHARYADLLERQGTARLGIVGLRGGLMPAFETASRYAQADDSVLITGETGTGKDVIARAIHALSRRARMPFVKINCGAIPESLIESELFGYARGAFSGAVGEKPGKIELAEGGTLFLDEIAELRVDLQTRLLHVVQDRVIERLGSTRRIDVNFRLISATNRDLRASIDEGSFREDLFFRIAVLPLEVPPLRERRGDIREFAARYLEEFGGTDGPSGLSNAALELLESHPWPGNVRELESAFKRALVLSRGKSELGAESFAFLREGMEAAAGRRGAEEEALEALSRLVEEGRLDPDDIEARVLERILMRHKDNALEAARASGLPKDRFYRVRKRLFLGGSAAR
jgi:two-component system, NtrC family, response regulator AtoC